MCGIFAYLGPKTDAGNIVLEGLKSLEYRGYDSWGVAIKLSNGKTYVEKHPGKIGDAELPPMKSKIAIGHTRWATHGGVTEQNAHPHADCNNEIFVVHNGIVENFEELKKALIKKGHTFRSQTDTEVISHLLEDKKLPLLDGRLKVVTILDVFKTLKGLNAIIVFIPKTQEFFAIKNSSPLVFGHNEKTKEYYLSSDYAGILQHTDKLYYLEDNQLLSIDRPGHQLFDSSGRKKPITFTTFKINRTTLALGSFPHYMIKEISEQPKVISNIVNTYQRTIEDLAQKFKHAYGTYLVGCGTAYYACLAGTYLFSKIAKRHTNASIGSEFSYLEDFLTPKSLILALSQSGETIDIIAPLKKAKEKNVKIAALTNVLGSTLYRMSDYKILLGAGPEKCVLSTKAFTAKIALLHLLAHSLNGGFAKGATQLKKAVVEIEKILRMKKIQNLAKKFKNREHIFVLGRGLSYPTALESALKMKEGSYIHAEAFAGGELKHGVIALIEKGTPVFVYNPHDETYEDTLSSAYEVKARGAYVIGLSDKSSPAYDEWIKVGYCEEATIIPNVVVAQLLGYHLTLARRHDPDKPRNLAKSVTVK
ncbi:glutamine--fructose-6-phosphate transaminase (isomerizing) [Candidatus Roizmanbacteria bacterium]|nr:glutamine--fructose-6-phosphate transaminase (isomerizing) [Candidatus Roizmanbacteria bacterium]